MKISLKHNTMQSLHAKLRTCAYVQVPTLDWGLIALYSCQLNITVASYDF